MMNTNDTPKTLLEAVKFFDDYENCRKFMVDLRWPDGVVKCPTCGSDHVTYMRATASGNATASILARSSR